MRVMRGMRDGERTGRRLGRRVSGGWEESEIERDRRERGTDEVKTDSMLACRLT